MTLVSNVRRHQPASASARAASGDGAGGVDDVVETPEAVDGLVDDALTLCLVGGIALEPIAVPGASLAAASHTSLRREANATCAPASQSVSPITRPIPAEAPTTARAPHQARVVGGHGAPPVFVRLGRFVRGRRVIASTP